MTGRAWAPNVRRLLAALSLADILVVAIAARLAWILACPNEPFSDQSVYHYHAEMMALGRGYIDLDGAPANYYPVGYPALLAPFYAAFGARYLVAYVLNVVLCGVAITGAFQLGRLLFGDAAGRLAALLVAAHPTFILMTTTFASENPFRAALPWALWLLVRMAREPRTGALALTAGAVIAAMAYVRPPALLLLSCPLVFGALERVPLRRRLRDAVVVAAVTLVALVPWGLRNERDFGVFALTSFNGGTNLYLGNNAQSGGDWMDEWPDEVVVLPVPERDRVLGRRAAQFIAHHPARYLVLCLNRLQLTLRSDTIGPTWNRVGIVRRLGKAAMLPLKVLCSAAHWALLAGLLLTLRRVGLRRLSTADWELAWVAALLVAPFVLILGGNRYVLPLMSLVCVWTASIVRTSVSDEARAAR